MPGGKICSVAICKSNSRKVKEHGESVKFFSFPKDHQIRKEWVRRCYRKDKFSTENKRICSKHFKPQDFEDEMKARILGIEPKILKQKAIPSLLLLPLTEVQRTQSERSKRVEKKEVQEIVKSLLSKDETKIEELSGLEEIVCDQKPQVHLEEQQSLEEKLNALQVENVHLKEVILQLEQELEISDSSFKERAKEVFKDFLSPNQIDVALKNCENKLGV